MTLVARNVHRAMVVHMVGSGGAWVWPDSGSGGWFSVRAFGSNLASVAREIFSRVFIF
jgi:hypothetical protein